MAFRLMQHARVLQWLAIPLVVLGATEYVARRQFASVPEWYLAAEADAAAHHIDAIFIGSSRVASAINVPIFEAEMRRRGGANMHAFDLGRGFTTLAEHYLALRNLLEDYPEQLRGCTVFLEAESGLSLPASWQGAWADREQPQLLVPLLRWRDLWGFAHSGSSWGEKITIATRVLLRWSTLVAHHERIREQILTAGGSWLETAVPTARQRFAWSGATLAMDHAASATIDLRALGGIRTDGLDDIRRLAHISAKERLENQTAARGWEYSIQADLVALLKANGARLIFFQTPESSIFSAGYATDVRRRDRMAFEEHVQKWGSIILKPHFVFDDSNFPDMWHLSRSRSKVFTGALVQAWIAADGRADSHPSSPTPDS